MPETKQYQMQTVDEDGTVLEILHPETESEIVSYIDTEPVINPIGGIPAGKTYPDGNVQQVIYDLLHPYVKPTISFSASPNGAVREKGTVLDTINLTANITKKSSPIKKVEFLKGSEVINTIDSPKANGGTEQYSWPANLSENATVKARVTDEQGSTVDSNSATYTFVYPLYIGSLDSDAAVPTEEQIEAMEKRIVNKGTQTFTYTIDSKRMAIACPPGWTISKILDPNNFDMTSSFTSHDVQVTGLDGTAQTYKVYVSNPTTQSGFKVTYQ